jgi:hypothetical protein
VDIDRLAIDHFSASTADPDDPVINQLLTFKTPTPRCLEHSINLSTRSSALNADLPFEAEVTVVFVALPVNLLLSLQSEVFTRTRRQSRVL